MILVPVLRNAFLVLTEHGYLTVLLKTVCENIVTTGKTAFDVK